MTTAARAPKKARDLRPRNVRREEVFADPVERTTLSFYRYVHIDDPQSFRGQLYAGLSHFGCLGRIYVAREGINVQMSVPKESWRPFDEYIQSLPQLRDVPYKIAVEEAAVPSFYKLTVKVKEKIVADGLDDSSFDVTNTGEYLSAEEMNEYIGDPDAIVVDMRNGYESEVGHFEGAITPDVDTFREELQVLPKILTVHKNKKIALYCTGGIRCEKASAWLRHNGFSDVRHLKGGIIEYKHRVESEGIENKFKGKNFVFDERLGERISDEIIADCHLCHKNKCDTHYHCTNQACHVLFIGCDACMRRKNGYCSYRCMTLDALPKSVKRRLIRNNHKKKLEHFKKNRLRTK